MALERVRTTLILFAVLAVAYAVTAAYATDVFLNDVRFVELPAQALAKDGTLDIDAATLEQLGTVQSFQVDGASRSDRFPGAVLFAVPFYFFGPSTFSVIPGALSAAVATALAMAFLHRALLRAVAPITALGAVLLMALGTGAWTVAADAPWTHGVTMLGLAIGMWGLASRRAVAAGLGYGVAILGRPHTIVVGAVAVVLGWRRDRDLRFTLQVCAGAAVGVAVLLVYSKLNSGSWYPLQGSYSGRSNAAQNAAASPPVDKYGARYVGSLLSPQRGILLLSPFVLLLLPGVVRAWRAAPVWVRSSVVGGLVYAFVQLWGNDFSGGAGFFSYRVTLELVLLSVPLLAMSYERWTALAPWRLVAFGALALAAVWWHALAAGWWELEAFVSPQWRSWDVPEAVEFGGPVGVVVAAAVSIAVLALVVRLARLPGAQEPPALPDDAPAPAEATS